MIGKQLEKGLKVGLSFITKKITLFVGAPQTFKGWVTLDYRKDNALFSTINDLWL